MSPITRLSFLIILTGIMLSFVLSNDCRGTTWIVDDTEGDWRDFSSVQDALNISSDRDEIRVYFGNYTETLIIENEISIIGNGSDSTYIFSPGEDEVITIGSNNVLVDGCALRNAGTKHSKGVVMAYQKNNISISNCSITNSRTGINIEYATNVTVEYCSLLDNDNIGIFVKYSNRVSIISCTISTGYEEDIFLYNCTNSTIVDTSTLTGVRIWGSNIWHYDTLAIDNTTIRGKPLVLLINERNQTLKSISSQIIIVDCEELYQTT